MMQFFRSLFTGLTDVSLAEKAFRDRIEARRLLDTPATEAAAAIRAEMNARVDDADWRGIGKRIGAWDRTRERCPMGRPKAALALQAVLDRLAVAACAGHDCHPDPILFFEDGLAARLEIEAAKHADLPVLAALAARVRIYQGWVSRGADYALHVSAAGWDGMARHFEKAAWLLGEGDPVRLNSPLLADTRHRLLAFMPQAERHVQRFYEDWTALDPYHQRAHDQHALMRLPRWFGTSEGIEVEARRAALRTADETGAAAYFSFYARALDASDASALPLDPGMFRQGAHDLVTLRGGDPAFVAETIQRMSWWTAIGTDSRFSTADRARFAEIAPQIEALRDDLLLTRLTAIVPDARDGGTRGALDLISRKVQDDLRAGATFRLDEGGLTVIPAAPQPDAPTLPAE